MLTKSNADAVIRPSSIGVITSAKAEVLILKFSALANSLVHACSAHRNRSGRLKLTKNIL